MSGFAGLFGGATPHALRRLARALDARGPAARWEGTHEGAGFVVVRSGPATDGPAVAVVHNRLIAVTGRAWNRRGLAVEVGLDAEAGLAAVVGELVELVGVDRAALRLSGDCDVAVWDPRACLASLARSRSGLRPLDLALGPDGYAFATDGRALRLAGLASGLDAASLAAIIRTGAALPPASPWRGAARLAAGESWAWRAPAAPTLTRPPALAGHPAGAGGNAERWLRSVRYGVELATTSRVRDAGPTAIALSGGLASAALLACRAPGATPELALMFDDPARPTAEARAAALGLRVVPVPLNDATFEALLDELVVTPAFLLPQAWGWAALGRAAWAEGATGLLGGVGAGVGFDPPQAGVRTAALGVLHRLRRNPPPPSSPARSASPLPDDDVGELPLAVRLAEAELAAFDAGAAAFGLAGLAPFADAAVIDVAQQVPAGVHHAGGRRALLAKLAGAGGVQVEPGPPQAPELPLARWLELLAPDSLPEVLAAVLDGAHVCAVVAAARAGSEMHVDRAFRYGVLGRLLAAEST